MSKINILDSTEIAQKIRVAAKKARSETEIQFEIERLIKNYFEKEDIEYDPRQNVTIIKGRPDTLYGRAIIEYKIPGTLKSSSKLASALVETHDNIVEIAQKTHEDRTKYTGIVVDGEHITFTKFRKNVWINEQLEEVTPETIRRMLEHLRGLSRKPLHPSNIIEDFGPNSNLAKKSIRELYSQFINSNNDRVKVLFNEWKRIFNQVCGYDFVSPKLSIKDLIQMYDIDSKKVDIEKLLFVIHSYYALFIKMLAAEVTVTFASVNYQSFLDDLLTANSAKFKKNILDLEEGGIFSDLGIKNFLEGDYFAWYTDAWNDQIKTIVEEIARKLVEYEPATASLEPEVVRDLLKHLYEELVPKKIRHDLGEYLTPDWLVEIVLEEIKFDGSHDKRILDPTCGSGSFLVNVLRKILENSKGKVKKNVLLKEILHNVVGFDLNPLAVIASRANYLIAISDLLRHRDGDVYIPVYLCDSISVSNTETLSGAICEVSTGVGTFKVSLSVLKHKDMSRIFSIIDECIKNLYKASEFISRLKNEIGDLDESSVNLLETMYAELLKLERLHINRIWTRVIKNSLAPLFIGKFDYVIGNPPWINWEHLPSHYRDSIKDLWEKYKLTEGSKGTAVFKRDISMSFVAVGVARYLKDDGKLGLLLPFTLFKTQGGAGFRKFLAQKCNVLAIHDMVRLYPFENAVTRTSLLLLEKGTTKFPIPSTVWNKNQGTILDGHLSGKDALYMTNRNRLSVNPIEGVNKPETSWLFLRTEAVDAIKNVLGKSEYEAHAASNTRGANGIFWIDIIEKYGTNLRIRNLDEESRSEVKKTTSSVEIEHVYPLLRGKNVEKWKAEPKHYIIVPHDAEKGSPLQENILKTKSPKTYDFLLSFKNNLENRKLYGKSIKDKLPFYMLFQITKEIFYPFKVVWKEISGEISGSGEFFASIVTPSSDKMLKGKPVIPDHKLMYIPFKDEKEAYYVVAMLNSSPIRLIVSGYTIETSISTHVLNHVKIPTFDPDNKIHQEISEISMKIHSTTQEQIPPLEYEIEKSIAKIYDITFTQMQAIQKSLL